MLDLILRPLSERVLIPLAKAVGRSIHPNTITVLAFAIGLVSCGLVLTGHTVLGFAVWLVNRGVDGLDGVVARVTGKQSDFGGYLDIMLDFVLYAALPVSFAIREQAGLSEGARLILLWSLVGLLAVFYVNTISWSYLSALIEKRKAEASPAAGKERTSVTMPRGLIEGTETIVFYSLLFFLQRWMALLMMVMAALTLVGAAQRFFWARTHLRPSRSDT